MKPGKGKKTTPITSHYNQEKPHSPSESSMRTRGNAYHPDEEDLGQNSDSITQQPGTQQPFSCIQNTKITTHNTFILMWGDRKSCPSPHWTKHFELQNSVYNITGSHFFLEENKHSKNLLLNGQPSESWRDRKPWFSSSHPFLSLDFFQEHIYCQF